MKSWFHSPEESLNKFSLKFDFYNLIAIDYESLFIFNIKV